MFVQEVHLFLARQLLVARQGDDFYPRSHDEERHVEPDLVVAGTRRPVGNGVSADLFRIASDGDGLENAFRRNGNGVAVVAQYVTENHVFQRFRVVLLRDIECHVFHCAQFVGVFFVLLQLFSAESTGVSTCCVHFISVLCKLHDGVARVKTATESDDDFLLMFHFLSVFLVFRISK